MSLLDRDGAKADWANDPVSPDAGDDVRAWLNPGAWRATVQNLVRQVWSIAQGRHTLRRLVLDNIGQAVATGSEVLRVLGGESLYEALVRVEILDALAVRHQTLLDADGVRVGLAADPTTYSRLALNFLAFTGARLGQGSDIKGTVCAQNVPRARGVIRVNRAANNTVELGGNPIGIASVTIVGTVIRVVLAGAWSSSIYQVDANIQLGLPDQLNAPVGSAARCEIINRVAGQFDIAVGPDALNSATKYEIGLTVYDAA